MIISICNFILSLAVVDSDNAYQILFILIVCPFSNNDGKINDLNTHHCNVVYQCGRGICKAIIVDQGSVLSPINKGVCVCKIGKHSLYYFQIRHINAYVN